MNKSVDRLGDLIGLYYSNKERMDGIDQKLEQVVEAFSMILGQEQMLKLLSETRKDLLSKVDPDFISTLEYYGVSFDSLNELLSLDYSEVLKSYELLLKAIENLVSITDNPVLVLTSFKMFVESTNDTLSKLMNVLSIVVNNQEDIYRLYRVLKLISSKDSKAEEEEDKNLLLEDEQNSVDLQSPLSEFRESLYAINSEKKIADAIVYIDGVYSISEEYDKLISLTYDFREFKSLDNATDFEVLILMLMDLGLDIYLRRIEDDKPHLKSLMAFKNYALDLLDNCSQDLDLIFNGWVYQIGVHSKVKSKPKDYGMGGKLLINDFIEFYLGDERVRQPISVSGYLMGEFFVKFCLDDLMSYENLERYVQNSFSQIVKSKTRSMRYKIGRAEDLTSIMNLTEDDVHLFKVKVGKYEISFYLLLKLLVSYNDGNTRLRDYSHPELIQKAKSIIGYCDENYLTNLPNLPVPRLDYFSEENLERDLRNFAEASAQHYGFDALSTTISLKFEFGEVDLIDYLRLYIYLSNGYAYSRRFSNSMKNNLKQLLEKYSIDVPILGDSSDGLTLEHSFEKSGYDQFIDYLEGDKSYFDNNLPSDMSRFVVSQRVDTFSDLRFGDPDLVQVVAGYKVSLEEYMLAMEYVGIDSPIAAIKELDLEDPTPVLDVDKFTLFDLEYFELNSDDDLRLFVKKAGVSLLDHVSFDTEIMCSGGQKSNLRAYLIQYGVYVLEMSKSEAENEILSIRKDLSDNL